MKERAAIIAFGIDPHGNVAVSTDQRKIWDDRVTHVLGTTAGTRVGRPNFGLSILKMPFDNREDVEDSIRRAVEDAFVSFLPSLNLISVLVEDEEGADVVTVQYSLPDLDEASTQVTVGTLALNGVNPPIEDI